MDDRKDLHAIARPFHGLVNLFLEICSARVSIKDCASESGHV